MYGRKYHQGLNAITTIAMTAFHAGAVSAFFFIDSGAILAAVILYVVAGMLEDELGRWEHRLHLCERRNNDVWVVDALEASRAEDEWPRAKSQRSFQLASLSWRRNPEGVEIDAPVELQRSQRRGAELFEASEQMTRVGRRDRNSSQRYASLD